MAAAESPVLLPPEEPPRAEHILLPWHGSKPTATEEKEVAPGIPVREGNAPECEDETTNDDRNDDGVSGGATEGSVHENRSDDGSEDSTQAGARRAVISAIEKMQRFQEAVQFNIVDELNDLRDAVSGLPARGRRAFTSFDMQHASVVGRAGSSPLRSPSLTRPRSPTRSRSPSPISPPPRIRRVIPPGLRHLPREPIIIESRGQLPRPPVRRRVPDAGRIIVDRIERRPASSGSR
jgi:hypothetical protein